jgi:outer membrane murein-binding lipoprotein Lpp
MKVKTVIVFAAAVAAATLLGGCKARGDAESQTDDLRSYNAPCSRTSQIAGLQGR